MKIFVQRLGVGEPLIFDVDSQTTLLALKTLIRDAEGHEANVGVKLVLGEIMLQENLDSLALEACGIQDGTTLALIWHAGSLLCSLSGALFSYVRLVSFSFV